MIFSNLARIFAILAFIFGLLEFLVGFAITMGRGPFADALAQAAQGSASSGQKIDIGIYTILGAVAAGGVRP